jgi:hypothetical protein
MELDDSSDAVCDAIPLPDSQILSLSLFYHGISRNVAVIFLQEYVVGEICLPNSCDIKLQLPALRGSFLDDCDVVCNASVVSDFALFLTKYRVEMQAVILFMVVGEI